MGEDIFFLFVAGSGRLLYFGGCLGAEYPTREIEFIVGFPPGQHGYMWAGSSAGLRKNMRASPWWSSTSRAEGAEGFSSLAAAKPDGYTIGLVSTSAILQPYLMKGVTFSYKKSFRIIAEIAYTAEGVYVKKGGPFDMPFQEIIKRAKEKPKYHQGRCRGNVDGLRCCPIDPGRCHRR